MTDVCLFVDRPRVIKYILRLRKILGITKFRDPEDATDWKSWYGKKHSPKEANRLEADIEDFLANEGFSSAFVAVCVAAAISYKVTDSCYRRVYAEKELRPNPNFDPDWLIDGEPAEEPMREHRMVIVVHPGATRKEVLRAYWEVMEGFLSFSRDRRKDQTAINAQTIDFSHWFSFNLYKHGARGGIHAKHRIKKARAWYWLHKKHRNYEKVQKFADKTRYRGKLRTIGKAIQSYRIAVEGK